MIDSNGLQQQIRAAMGERRSRYIVVTAIDGEEHDIGEVMIGPESNAENIGTELTERMEKMLRRHRLTDAQITRAVVSFIEAPLLY